VYTGCRKVTDEVKTTINGLSDINLKYGAVLTISGSNFDTSAGAYEFFITDSVKKYTLVPLSVSKDQIQLEIYNQGDPESVLDLTSFYVGIKTATNIIMSDKKVNLVSSWTKVKDFPGTARYAPGFFSIGNYGYYGCGMSTSSQQYSDMWRYDPADDKWIRMHDFPGGIRSHLVSTSDGKSGFEGLGILMSPVTYCSDFWKYDP